MTVDRQTIRAQLEGVDVSVSDLQLTLDRTWSPYVQGMATINGLHDVNPDALARFRVRLEQRFTEGKTASEIAALWAPKTAATIAAELAPKTASEIAALFETQLNPDAFPSTRITADLLVRDVRLSLDERTTTLTLASDDMRLFDAALVSTSPLPFASTSIRSIVEDILARLGVALSDGPDDADLDDPPILAPGQTYRDFLTPLLQQTGLRLYADERRVWQLVDADAQLEGGITLSTARDVTIASAELDREQGGYDSVVIEYAWTVEPDTFVAYDVAGPPRPRKTFTQRFTDTPYPGPGAAARVLKRMSRLRRIVPATAASNYNARPTMSARLSSAALPQQSGRIARVMFQYPGRIMRADLYDLEQLDPRSVRAIPPTYRTRDLPGLTKNLDPTQL